MPDGITYTTKGGYAALKFSTLINAHGGGFTSPPSATGWRTGRVGPRVVVVDPEDAVTYFRGMYVATYDQVHVLGGGQQAGRKLLTSVQQKYAGPGMTWDQAAAIRLKHLHFNSVASNSRWLAGQGGITQQVQSSVGTYTLSGGFGALPEAVKDVARYGVRQYFPGNQGWVGRHLVDAFDPKFTQYINQEWAKLGPNPDIPFYMADDGDYLYFFSSGHGDETGCTPEDSNWTPHGGFVALISNPIITGPFTDPRGGIQRWTVDTKNHTKHALVAFLRQTYGNDLAAFNAAWGSTYTSFDSTGSWGVGTGLMDEDGLRPRAWLGKDGAPFYQKAAGQNDAFNSTRWAPGVKRDLDRFLGMMMDAYLRPFAERLQASNPGALFAGHTGVGHRGGMSRRPVWESYGRWLHILRAGADSGDPNYVKINQQIRAWTGKDLPWITALYFPNNDDSSLYYIPKGDGTQAARGANIAQRLKALASIRLADGTFPVVGTNFWGMYDQVGERIGWGLWTYNDNGYDGRSYLTSIPDPLATGRMTLTEDRVYGDSHTPIKAAQVALFALIQAQIAGTAPIPIPEPEPTPTPGDPMNVTITPARPLRGDTVTVAFSSFTGHRFAVALLLGDGSLGNRDLDWCYLNGGKSLPPAAPIPAGSVTFPLPLAKDGIPLKDGSWAIAVVDFQTGPFSGHVPEIGGTWPFPVGPVPEVDGAEVVEIAGPNFPIALGSFVAVTMRLKNVGTTTWSAPAGYHLRALAPGWQGQHVSHIQEPMTVPPGSEYTFMFGAVIDNVPLGPLPCRWQLHKGDVAFGPIVEVPLTVEAAPAPEPEPVPVPSPDLARLTARVVELEALADAGIEVDRDLVARVRALEEARTKVKEAL